MKTLKNVKTGEIKRLSNQEADKTVGNVWKFVPKNEWKLATRPKKETKEKN
jgi:hypothetical protein